MILNEREENVVKRSSEEAKEHRNAEKIEIWRDGKLVDVRVTKIYDRDVLKETH